MMETLEKNPDWQALNSTDSSSNPGVRCLEKSFIDSELRHKDNIQEVYCNSTWDNIYCWPATPAGVTIRLPCSMVFRESDLLDAEILQGDAVRVCLDNGTWSQGLRTNYEECAASFLMNELNQNFSIQMKILVPYMVFTGSVVSLIFLGSALICFCHFKTFWSQPIIIHVHVMIALVIRCIVLLIITGPLILTDHSYHDSDFLCKAVLAAHLYSTLISVSWMLIQGIFLNSRLTINVFSESEKNFHFYYLTGWVSPIILVVLYYLVMIINEHSEECWKGYAKMPEIYILLVPTILALVLNGLFLCNILRIVIKKGRRRNQQSEVSKVVGVAKATLILCPILGLNNLFLIYNPGGGFDTFYVALNTFVGSTQGIFVTIVYCCNFTEVHHAIRRSYRRFLLRRDVNSMRERRTYIRASSLQSTSV